MAQLTKPKRIITTLNILILLSLLILPTLLYLSAANAIGIGGSLDISDVSQSYSEGKIEITGILAFDNPGPFGIDASVTASLRDTRGAQLSIKEHRLQLPQGKHEAPLLIEFDLNQLTEEDIQYLIFNRDNITLTAQARLAMPPIIEIGTEATANIDWLPPLHDLTIGTPTITGITPSQISVEVPVSFENQSGFPLEATLVTKIYDSNTKQIGGGQLQIHADSGSKFSDVIRLTGNPPTDGIDPRKDTTLVYTAESELSLSRYNFTATLEPETIQLEWGALFKNPTTTYAIIPMNLTTTQIILETTYTNNNEYLPLDADITPLLKKDNQTIFTGLTQTLHTGTKSQGAFETQLIVPNTTLTGGDITLTWRLSTSYGEFTMEASQIG